MLVSIAGNVAVPPPVGATAQHLLRAADTKESVMKSLKGLVVMIVDDDTDARELTAVVLSTAGAHVAEASSGEEALELLSSEPFDVVVSDIAMPDMDGMKLMRTLREKVLASSGARGLAFTAFASDDDRHRALSAGFDQHLGKTADATTLVSVVARLAGRAGVEPS